MQTGDPVVLEYVPWPQIWFMSSPGQYDPSGHRVQHLLGTHVSYIPALHRAAEATIVVNVKKHVTTISMFALLLSLNISFLIVLSGWGRKQY